MLSLGAVAFRDGVETDHFYQKLEPLAYAHQNRETMKWWGKFPAAWAEATKDPRPPARVMYQFVEFVEGHEDFVICAWPVAFDVMFIRWYLQYLLSKNIHSWTSLDLRSYIAGVLGSNVRNIHSAIPKSWDLKGHDSGVEMDHTALSDAREQGQLLMEAIRFRHAMGNFTVGVKKDKTVNDAGPN